MSALTKSSRKVKTERCQLSNVLKAVSIAETAFLLGSELMNATSPILVYESLDTNDTFFMNLAAILQTVFEPAVLWITRPSRVMTVNV